MRKVLASLKPYYYYLVGEGIKKIEVRKGMPKASDWDNGVLFYMSKDEKSFAKIPKEFQEKYRKHFGKVGMQFICDKVFLLHPYTYDRGSADLEHRKFIQTFEGSSKENEIFAATCLTQDEMFDYIGAGNYGFGWHISDLKIYDKPKELSEFYIRKFDNNDYCSGCIHHETPITEYPCNDCRRDAFERKYLTRPPQSWCYVER